MATVNMSDTLREKVRVRIQDIFSDREIMLTQQIHDQITPQQVYETLFRDELHLLSSLSDAYVTKAGEIALEMTIPDVSGEVNKTIRFKAPQSVIFKLPPRVKEVKPAVYGLVKHHHYSDNIFLIDTTDPRWEYFMAIAMPVFAEIGNLRREHRSTRQQVNNLLEKCKTLQQALTAYPMLIELVPEDVKQKHFEKVEKKPRVKAEVEALKLDTLTSAVVANKIGGGNA